MIQNIYTAQLNNKKANNRILKWAQDMNRDYSKEDIKMLNECMKRCFISLVIREMQIKTTMRYHFIFTRMAIIEKKKNNKYWQGCGEI